MSPTSPGIGRNRSRISSREAGRDPSRTGRAHPSLVNISSELANPKLAEIASKLPTHAELVKFGPMDGELHRSTSGSRATRDMLSRRHLQGRNCKSKPADNKRFGPLALGACAGGRLWGVALKRVEHGVGEEVRRPKVGWNRCHLPMLAHIRDMCESETGAARKSVAGCGIRKLGFGRESVPPALSMRRGMRLCAWAGRAL